MVMISNRGILEFYGSGDANVRMRSFGDHSR
jgi:hypothetical protein